MFGCKINTRSSAKVVDGNLIISLPDAIEPVVWRMALGEARAAAIEVKEKNDAYVLVLKYPKGDSSDIAPFSDKKSATNALLAIAKAMQSAEGRLHAHAAPPSAMPSTTRSLGWKWLIPLGLVILGVYILSQAGDRLPMHDSMTLSSGTAAQNDQTGVPLSADSLLNGM